MSSYYSEADDIANYWELRYIEWLKNPDWGVFETKDAWFEERFEHILASPGRYPLPDKLLGSGWHPGNGAEKYFEPNGSVLEFGCGNAMYAQPLLRRFKNYVGFDTSPTAIKIAEEYYHGKSLRQRMELLRFTDLDSELDHIFRENEGQFDCVVSITVLQHQPVELRRKIIRAIKYALKPDGVYVGLEMQGHTMAWDMPPFPEEDWIQAWEPMTIVKDVPANRPEWALDNVWVAR